MRLKDNNLTNTPDRESTIIPFYLSQPVIKLHRKGYRQVIYEKYTSANYCVDII